MENSFFYFYSAVPQVLSGVLALFGVFVIFKLQSLTIELLSVGKEFLHYTLGFNNKNDTNEITTLRNKINAALNRSVESRNIMTFKENLDLSTEKKIYDSDILNKFAKKFTHIYSDYKSLKDNTINSSIFTAVIILLSLGIIPFEKWLICYPVILFLIFISVIICMIIIFYKLISILKKAFN